MPTATCSICFEELLCASNPTVANKIITNTLNTPETPKPLSKHSSTNSLASTATASTTTGCGTTVNESAYASQPSAPLEFSSRPSTSTSASFSTATESGNVGDEEENSLTAPSNNSMSVSATPCGHVFHTTCVAKWIDQHRHCPTCRQPVLTSSQLVKLFLAEDKVSSSAMVLYGNNCGAAALRSGYERHPSWIGMQNSSGFAGLSHKPYLPMLQRPHSIVGSATSSVGVSGGGHWSSQRGGDVNVEESKIIMDVMQCQMEDLEGECQKLRKRLLTVEDQLQTKVEEVSAMESKMKKRRSASVSEEPDVATTSQNLAIAMLAAESNESVERSAGIKTTRRRASSISNIQQNLLELRREYDNLQSVSQELRTEIAILNDSMENKERDVCDKTQRISELEERNRRLAEEMEANNRINSDLRVNPNVNLCVYQDFYRIENFYMV